MTLSLLLSTLNIAQWLGDNVFSIILALLTLLVAILTFLGIRIVLPHQTREWRKKAIDEKLLDDFKDYNPNSKPQKDTPYEENPIEGHIYVQPYIEVQSPQGRKQDSSLRDFFLKKVFVPKPVNKVFFLLGNAGSGKTAALTHLLIDYINRHSQRTLPYDIFILSLRRNNVFEEIENIKVEDNKHAILLLDALDENLSAQDPKQQKQFLKELEAVYPDSRFAAIVVSCRNQFFKDANQEPSQTDIPTGGANPYLQIWRLQLKQFTEAQVRDYIDQRFDISNHSELRSKAIEYINKHRNNKEIAFRPLILTYIRDLVEAHEPLETTLDFYYYIVQKEIPRNIAITKLPCTDELLRQWWSMIVQVASSLCNKRKPNTKDDNDDYLTYNELLSIIFDHNIALPDNAINEDLFQQRSLLTLNNKGYHFSHRSFFEFFLAYHFLLQPDEIGYIGGLDFALEIFDQLYDAFTKGDKKPFSMLDAEVDEKAFAFAYLNISNRLYDLNHFSKALPLCKNALDIFSRLSQTNPEAYRQHKATALNNLANLHVKTNNHTAAEKEFTEALSSYRSLAEANPEDFLPYVATTLNNLALLHSDTNNHAAAGEEYTEALSIYRSLAETNPEAFLPDVATTLNNLANLHSDTNNYAAAEKEYTEALSTYRSLAEANPDAFLPRVADTLNNLAILHADTNNPAAAEDEYTEALRTYRSLAEANPDAFLPDVAMTLNNLALLHSDTNNHAAAEEEYTEALSTYRSLAEANPDAFLPYVAGTLFNIALLHLQKGELDEAERAAQESLDKYRTMAEKSHVAFDKDVQDAEELLAIIQKLRTMGGGTE